MLLRVNNNWTEILETTGDEVYEIYSQLSVDTSGLVESNFQDEFGSFRKGLHWQKSHWSPVDLENRRFPTGLLWRVLKIVPGHLVRVEDARKNRVVPIRSPKEACLALGIENRDYQITAGEVALEQQRGIVDIATNGGKTEIMAEFCLCFPEGTTITLVAPDLTALTEICERFELRGIEHCVIDASRKEFQIGGVNVCSLDSLRRLEDVLELLQATQVMLWDECDDSSTAVSGWEVGMNSEAYYRLYFSGTPFTDNEVHNVKLVGLAGEKIVNLRNNYLIGRGFSAKPTVVIHSSQDCPRFAEEKQGYASARKEWITVNEEFARRVIEDVKPVLKEGVVIVFEHKPHGRLLQDLCRDANIRCKYIDGGSSKAERDDAKRMLENGFIDVVLASSIWNRALDFPYPEHWFYVGGMKASNRIKQRWGRALRKKRNENNTVTIHEYYIFGHLALEEHSRIRYRLALEEKFDVVVADAFLVEHLNMVRETKNLRESFHGTTADERLTKALEFIIS